MNLKKIETYDLSLDSVELEKLLFALQWLAEIKDSISVYERKGIDKAVCLKILADFQNVLLGISPQRGYANG